MKLLTSLLFVGAFALLPSVDAQDMSNQGNRGGSTDDVVSSISGIHRPTPTPGTTTLSKPTGPMTADLYKDAKAKSASTTFSASETVYLVCTNISGNKGDKLGVTWYGEAGKSGKAKKLTTSESALPNTGVFNPTYNLPPAKGGSPAGPYYVELILNGKVLKKASFVVK